MLKMVGIQLTVRNIYDMNQDCVIIPYNIKFKNEKYENNKKFISCLELKELAKSNNYIYYIYIRMKEHAETIIIIFQ